MTSDTLSIDEEAALDDINGFLDDAIKYARDKGVYGDGKDFSIDGTIKDVFDEVWAKQVNQEKINFKWNSQKISDFIVIVWRHSRSFIGLTGPFGEKVGFMQAVALRLSRYEKIDKQMKIIRRSVEEITFDAKNEWQIIFIFLLKWHLIKIYIPSMKTKVELK